MRRTEVDDDKIPEQYDAAFRAQKSPPLPLGEWRAQVLATTYSRKTYRLTTIGAAVFHFRVRNGAGWDHCALVTRSLEPSAARFLSGRRGSRDPEDRMNGPGDLEKSARQAGHGSLWELFSPAGRWHLHTGMENLQSGDHLSLCEAKVNWHENKPNGLLVLLS